MIDEHVFYVNVFCEQFLLDNEKNMSDNFTDYIQLDILVERSELLFNFLLKITDLWKNNCKNRIQTEATVGFLGNTCGAITNQNN